MPSTNGSNGRDAAGRFAKGNAGGPGNPFARRVARLRASLLDAVSEEDLGEVVAGLMQAAKKGDVAAAKLLLSYVLGQPTPAVDPDRVDVHELRTIQETVAAMGEVEFEAVIDGEQMRRVLELIDDR